MKYSGKLVYFFIDDELEDQVLTIENIHTSAELFLHSFLDNLETPLLDVSYNITRNASFKDKGIELEKADIGMSIVLKSVSGVKTHATCTVRVRGGQFIEPSIMKLNGSIRLISQDTFDEIDNATTFHYPIRNLFSIHPEEDTSYPWVTNDGDFWRE